MKCYLCGSADLTLLTTQLRRGPGCVWHCKVCDIAHLENGPGDLQKYYGEEYRKAHGPKLNEETDYADIFDSYVNYQGARLALVAPLLGHDKRLLEVGCSTGHFLYNVKSMVKEAVGVDYDTEAAHFAAQKTGCVTYGCGLDEAGLDETSFDVVCSTQTMEHVADPIQFAMMLRKYLKPNGMVYVEVPSLLDPLLHIYANEGYKPFYYHEAHPFYFAPRSLETVMRRAGFEGKIHFEQDYNFINHMSWILTNKPQDSCEMGLRPAALPVSTATSSMLRDELNTWVTEVDRQYKAILVRHGVTENIAFVGSLVS